MKSANCALQQLGNWTAPERVTLFCFVWSKSMNRTAAAVHFSEACSVWIDAGVGSADRVAGDREAGAGAARGRPHLLLLELPFGYQNHVDLSLLSPLQSLHMFVQKKIADLRS